MSRWDLINVPKGAKQVSFSQLDTFDRCWRLWHLDKVEKVPRLKRKAFNFGSIFHGVAERYLLAGPEQRVPSPRDCDDAVFNRAASVWTKGPLAGQCPGDPIRLYPDLWYEDADGSVNEGEQQVMRTMMSSAITNGVLTHLPGGEVERPFSMELIPGTWIIGFIDHCNLFEIEDHKTAKTTRYLLKAEDLKKNRQLLLYGKVVNNERLRAGMEELDQIPVAHNAFVHHVGDKVKGRLTGKAPIVRKTNSFITKEEIEKNWVWMQSQARLMVDVRKVDAPMKVPGAATGTKACNKYGGCTFLQVCGKRESLAQCVTRIHRLNGDAPDADPLVPYDPYFDPNEMTLPATNAMAAAQAGAAPAPVAPAAAAPAAAIETGLALPWAFNPCEACGARGVDVSGKPCQVCTARQQMAGGDLHPSKFEWGLNDAGTEYWWRRQDGMASGTVPTAAPVVQQAAPAAAPALQPAVPAPAPAPAAVAAPAPAPAPAPAAPAPVKAAPAPAPAPAMPQAPAEANVPAGSQGELTHKSPPKSFTLCIGCAPQRTPGTKKVWYLQAIVAQFQKDLEVQAGKDYYEMDTWGRREAMAKRASEVLAAVGTGYLVAGAEDGASTSESKALFDRLCGLASLTIG